MINEEKLQKSKISDKRKKSVRDHIWSFSAVESHYTRSKTERKYLPRDLSVTKMYLLYKENMDKEDKEPVKLSMYQNIFNSEFNIGFHIPKKDLCSICNRFNNLNNTEKTKIVRNKLKKII